MLSEIAKFLTGEEGRRALRELAERPADLSEARQLATLSRLRKTFTPEQAAGLMEVATARLRGTAKFPNAPEMFFTRAALEQSSSQMVASYRAQRFVANLPQSARVADLGCGIGGDSLPLAQHFQVTGVDLDAARLVFAVANAQTCGVAANFQAIEADISEFDVAGYDALFFDPARRTVEGRRIFSVEDYAPPLSIVHKWLRQVPNIAVKISPGVDYRELDDYDCEVEIISENGDVKEAVLWFGALRTKAVRRATLLPSGTTLIASEHSLVAVTPPQKYLYEPDGAVIRARLVRELALQIGATQIDPDIAYLTANELVTTPFARAFEILEFMPFNLKKLQARLQALNTGRVTIKKRGSPLEPQELERLLKLKKSNPAEFILVLTHIAGEHSVIICQPN
jgi:SAM-dependent methyltransferase